MSWESAPSQMSMYSVRSLPISKGAAVIMSSGENFFDLTDSH